MLADALAEPLADADAEGWEELEPHALSPRAAAGTTPSSRVRRLRGEVMVVPLYGGRLSVVDVSVVVGRGEARLAAVGIGFIVCLCPELSLSSGGFAG